MRYENNISISNGEIFHASRYRFLRRHHRRHDPCLGAAFAKHMRAPENGYYVIRWNNTGVCTIWNTDLHEKPWHFFSDYTVVSKPVPTFTEAAESRKTCGRAVLYLSVLRPGVIIDQATRKAGQSRLCGNERLR